MTSKFELLLNNEMNDIYITESMQTYWLHMLDAYREERDKPYSDDFNL